MKRAMVLLLTTMLCACIELPKKDSLSPLMDKWVGRPASDLVTASGYPHDVHRLDSGVVVYEYFKSTVAPSLSSSGQQPHGWHYEPYFETLHGTWSPVKVLPGKLVPDDISDIRKHPKESICMVFFNIDANNNIKSWSQEGEGC